MDQCVNLSKDTGSSSECMKNGSIEVFTRSFFAENSTTGLVTSAEIGAEFRNATNGVHWLGTFYQLRNTSFAVAEEQNPNQVKQTIYFNLLFSISTLPLPEDEQSPSSHIINSSIIVDMLNNLYHNSKINETFLTCRILSLRSAGEVTVKVHAVCNFKNESKVQQLDRAVLYHEFRDKINNFLSLELYSLDNFTVDAYSIIPQK
ncbi:mucin-16-like [Scyliorhinus torazame]|uniref:mucin-16-like n=1 Tax=Scyliorhinus torazame TaxID=75743 RepID=UPI003B5978F2